MKLTLCFLLLVGFYFLLSNGENPKKLESQRIPPTTPRSSQGNPIIRGRNARRQQRVKKASKIVCTYAITGQWPPYPRRLKQMVNYQARRIAMMPNENIRSFCAKFKIATGRPQQSTRRPQSTTTRRFTTRRPPYQIITTRVPIYYSPPSTQYPTTSSSIPTTNFPVFTIPFISSTSSPSTTFSTTTRTPSTSLSFSTTTPLPIPSTSLSSSTTTPLTTPFSLNRGILIPLAPILTTTPTTTTTSTTTTQKAPTGSASAYYSGSGSSYYSGSGSAYYSATGSLTAKSGDQSSRLTRKSNDVATRSFKAKNGDIIIKWTPGGGGKLKKMSAT